MIDRRKEQQWRKEYLQEMEIILTQAAMKYDLERVREQLTPEEFGDEDFPEDDDFPLVVFLCNKMLPLMELIIFVMKNDPFNPKHAVSNEGEYPRYTALEMFNFISGMTNYGKYRIANHFPGNDSAYLTLLEAILTNDEQLFLETVEKEQVDFSEFRRGISESMFVTQSLNQFLQQFAAPFLDPKSGEIEMDEEEMIGFEQFLSEHMPPSSREAFGVFTSIQNEISELSGEEIEDKQVVYISELHLSRDMWVDYFQQVVIFCTLEPIINCHTDAEIAVINSFLDDPKTNHILGDIERTVYILSDKELNPGKLFVPRSIRYEIENGELDGLIGEIHGHVEEVGPDKQEPADLKPSQLPGKEESNQFKWPSWEEFNEKTIKGIPAHFDYITKHVAVVEQDFKTPEGYEHFKDFMNLVAEYGSINNDADMKTLLQFVTGKAFDGAKKKIRWKADNFCGRILYFVVQWISNDNDKLAMVDRMTDFYYPESVKDEDKDKGLSNPSVFLQGAKGIKDSVLKNLHFYYNIIPETREDAKKKRK